MSFPKYRTYQRTAVPWLSDIPADWGIGAARRLFVRRRQTALPTDQQLSVTQRFGAVPQADFMQKQGQKVALALKGVGDFQHVAKGDFVISLRTFEGGIEHSAFDGCVSPAYTVLRPSRAANGGFWRYLFKSHAYVEVLRSMTDGIRDGKSISYEQFAQVPLPLIPMAEEAAISAFLDRETARIDALVAEQQALIDLLSEKRQAVISHAVTKGLNPDAPMKSSGVESLGDVPAHWSAGPLKRFWKVIDCKHVTAEFVDDGIPVVSIREVQGRWVNLEDAKRTTEKFYQDLIEGNRLPQEGDLIFSRNATVGEVAQVSATHPRFAVGQDVVILRRRCQGSSPDYLHHVLRSSIIAGQLGSLMIGSTFKRINVEEVRTLMVPWPSANEQRQIAAALEPELERFDRLSADAELAVDLLRARRTALISAAVTGQIDVRGQAAVEVA